MVKNKKEPYYSKEFVARVGLLNFQFIPCPKCQETCIQFIIDTESPGIYCCGCLKFLAALPDLFVKEKSNV